MSDIIPFLSHIIERGCGTLSLLLLPYTHVHTRMCVCVYLWGCSKREEEVPDRQRNTHIRRGGEKNNKYTLGTYIHFAKRGFQHRISAKMTLFDPRRRRAPSSFFCVCRCCFHTHTQNNRVCVWQRSGWSVPDDGQMFSSKSRFMCTIHICMVAYKMVK